jgi:hypothetical protein
MRLYLDLKLDEGFEGPFLIKIKKWVELTGNDSWLQNVTHLATGFSAGDNKSI